MTESTIDPSSTLGASTYNEKAWPYGPPPSGGAA